MFDREGILVCAFHTDRDRIPCIWEENNEDLLNMCLDDIFVYITKVESGKSSLVNVRKNLCVHLHIS